MIFLRWMYVWRSCVVHADGNARPFLALDTKMESCWHTWRCFLSFLPSLIYVLQVGMRKAMTVLKMGWRPGLVIFPQNAINPKPNVFQPTCSSVFNANIQTHHMFLQCCVWNLNELFRLFVLIQLLPGLIVPLCIFISVQQMLVLTKPSLGGCIDVMTITFASISALFVMS